MRQMVLNHASVHAPGSSREAVVHWLVDLSKGMGRLIADGVVDKLLRTDKEPYQTPCLADYSLHDAFLGLQREGHREQFQFLARLTTKSPLLRDMPKHVEHRFLGCEGVSVPPEDSEPLVLCAVANSVAVGLPSAPSWDQDQVTVQFNELLPDETFIEKSEMVDNLTRYQHAAPISQRHSERLARDSDPTSLWENKQTYFPDLMFGPGVENNLKAHAGLFDTIVGRLIDINRSAAEWKTQGGPTPTWGTKVTDESQLTPKHLNKRRFTSCRGTQELFTWHARVGKHYRIHLRFDAGQREVEIGYIGPHLPL